MKEYTKLKKQLIQDTFIRRTASDKVLRHKALMNAKNPNYDRCKCELASLDYKFFNKKASANVVNSAIMTNQQLAKELHNSNIRIFGLLI